MLSASDPRHGTVNGYRNHGCRCDACREAHRTYPPGVAARRRYNRKRHLPRDVRLAIVAEQSQPCGTHAAYVRHRDNGETPCDACRAGEADYKRRRRALARTNLCGCGCGGLTAGRWLRGHHKRIAGAA